MSIIEGYFFDLDGTLLDTSMDIMAVFNTMHKLHKQPKVDSAYLHNFLSEGAQVLTQKAYPTKSKEQLEDYTSLFFKLYESRLNNQERQTKPTIYLGINVLIEALNNQKIPWGIITNRPRRYTNVLVEQYAILEKAQVVLCPEDVTEIKPHPEALLLACKQLSCDPKNSLYMGDHQRDIAAGNNAGMTTIIAGYGFLASWDNPKKWLADCFINHPEEMLVALKKSNWKLTFQNYLV